MPYETLLVTKEPPLAIVTVNRPPANALSRKTIEELHQAFDELAKDENTKVIIVTGAGQYIFIAGADINEFTTISPEEGKLYIQRGHELFNKIESFSKPVIAAVNGACVGGGNELAMSCDIRISAESARFGQPEVTLGIIPAWGGTARLTRLIGKTKAIELLLTGDMLKSSEALRYGLVNKVVPDNELMVQTKNIAKRLAMSAPKAMAKIKEVVFKSHGAPYDAVMKYEQEGAASVFETTDAKEGVQAFLQKRKPRFTGK